jgi:peroxiredoxin
MNDELKYYVILPFMLLYLTVVGCSSVVDEADNTVERVHVGDRVPLFSVTVSEGEQVRTFSTAQLTGETVIVFFHTSCSDCQRDLPLLNDYYLQHKDDKGFRMVAISREEGAESVAAFWEAKHLQIPYFAQTDRRIYNLFATSIIPRIYFVSAQGIVTRIDVEKFSQ